MDLKKILKDIEAKDLHRDIDESYAGGFWDLSYQLENKQEEIYNTLWEIVEYFMEERK